MKSIIGVLGKPRGESVMNRRAVDWSRVTWIGEAPDGLAHIYFDKEIGAGSFKIQDWTAVAVDFDEAVNAWREWKGEKAARWWRVCV